MSKAAPKTLYSSKIIMAMIDNGFVSPDYEAPPDYLLFVSRAIYEIETALTALPEGHAEGVSDIVAAMFDNGFCNRKKETDPVEWINYAVQAIKSIRSDATL